MATDQLLLQRFACWRAWGVMGAFGTRFSALLASPGGAPAASYVASQRLWICHGSSAFCAGVALPVHSRAILLCSPGSGRTIGELACCAPRLRAPLPFRMILSLPSACSQPMPMFPSLYSLLLALPPTCSVLLPLLILSWTRTDSWGASMLFHSSLARRLPSARSSLSHLRAPRL